MATTDGDNSRFFSSRPLTIPCTVEWFKKYTFKKEIIAPQAYYSRLWKSLCRCNRGLFVVALPFSARWSCLLEASLWNGKVITVATSGTGRCPWWHHDMETLSVLLALCAGNPPVTAVRDFGFLCCQDEQLLNKQSICRWFATPWCSCNIDVMQPTHISI